MLQRRFFCGVTKCLPVFFLPPNYKQRYFPEINVSIFQALENYARRIKTQMIALTDDWCNTWGVSFSLQKLEYMLSEATKSSVKCSQT
jgi:hypothetical protein